MITDKRLEEIAEKGFSEQIVYSGEIKEIAKELLTLRQQNNELIMRLDGLEKDDIVFDNLIEQNKELIADAERLYGIVKEFSENGYRDDDINGMMDAHKALMEKYNVLPS